MGITELEFDLPPGAAPVQSYVFSPGETVKGRVRFHVRIQEKIDHIQIVFKGKIYTLIYKQRGQSRSRDTEEIVLFREQEVLFRGPVDARPQTFEWPFSFTFPTTVSHDRGQHSGDQLFLPSGPAPLPPDFECSGTGFTGRGEGFVSYTIKVQVNAGSLTRSDEKRQPLHFCPTLQSVLPPQELKLVRFPMAQWSSKTLRPEQHSFKQKLNHVFSSDPNLRTPSISFKLQMGLPAYLVSEQSVALPVALKWNRTGPTDPEDPTLVLEHIHVSLQGSSAIRAKTIFADTDRVFEDTEGRVSFNRQGLRLPLDGTSVEVVADFSMASFPQFGQIRPGFRTWTIAHGHTLKVCVLIKHVETGYMFSVKQGDIPFTYLPPHTGENALGVDTVAPPPMYKPGEAGPSIGHEADAPPEYDYEKTAVADGDRKVQGP